MCFDADDLIVWSDCLECHKKHLQQVFDRLKEANLMLKASKCKFAMEKIKYLGHYSSKDGVSVNPEIISTYKTPKNVKQVRQFLGLTRYYR